MTTQRLSQALLPTSRTLMACLLSTLVCGACASTNLPPQPLQARGRSGAPARQAATPRAAQGPAAAAAQPGGSAHFALIGDFGYSGTHEQQVADLVLGFAPEFIVTLGDNNYPNGAAETLDENVGRYYGSFIALKPGAQSAYPTSPTQKFFPTLGNHDWRAEGAKPYLAHFDLPGHGRYYTVRQGPVEFFIIDSDPHEPDGVSADGIQGQWLKKQLQASLAPWKLVILHHPPYSSGRHGSNAWMQWPYRAWGADAVLGGHDHAYEHLVVDGMSYIVMGLSGAPKDKFKVACNLPAATSDHCYDDNYGALFADATTDALTLTFTTVDGRTQDVVPIKHPVGGAQGEAWGAPRATK